MNNPVAVALVMRAPFGRRFRMFATARVTAELRAGRKNLPLDLFQFLAGAGHIKCEMPNEKLDSPRQ
jgi:hypothetical protein